MQIRSDEALARVTYRANRPDGREADLTLTMESERATVADAWRRLTEAFGQLDPMSLEIEVRRPA